MAQCRCGCGLEANKMFVRGHHRRTLKAVPMPARCACGCGETTSIWRGKPRKFVAGHHARGENNARFGVSLTPETKAKIGASNKKRIAEGAVTAAVAGWKHTDEARKKMSVSGRARVRPKFGLQLTCRTCGQLYYVPNSKRSTSFYCSLSCSGKGSCTGAKNPFFGKTHSQETRQKLRIASANQRARAPVLPTTPERILHGALQELGLGFITEHAIGVYCVDVFIPSLNLVVFVDGCYWHACPTHFPLAKKPRGDAGRVPYLNKCGFNVVIIWEHELCPTPKNLKEAVASSLKPYLTPTRTL